MERQVFKKQSNQGKVFYTDRYRRDLGNCGYCFLFDLMIYCATDPSASHEVALIDLRALASMYPTLADKAEPTEDSIEMKACFLGAEFEGVCLS